MKLLATMSGRYDVNYKTEDGQRSTTQALQSSWLSARCSGANSFSDHIDRMRTMHGIYDRFEGEATTTHFNATKRYPHTSIPWYPGGYDLLYTPGPRALAFVEANDRKYLRELAKTRPELFLEEMTPVANHSGSCSGLDLREVLHCTYQQEFQDEVARVCRELGLTSHPAWIQPQITAASGDANVPAIPIDLAQNEKGGAVATVLPVVKLEDSPKPDQKALIARLTEERNAHLAETRDAVSKIEQLQTELAKANEKSTEAQVEIQALKDLLVETKAQLAHATRVAIPSLMRIWVGKNTPKDTLPQYQPVAKKTDGTAVGFIAEEVHPSKIKRYMAKSGFPKDEHKVSATLSTRRERHYRSYLAIIQELLAAHLYTLLGHGSFYVPKHRLSMMDVMNDQTKDHALAIALMGEVNEGRAEEDKITQSLHLLSRWMDGYRDLSKLEECYLDSNDQEPKSFQACVEAGQVPEYASISGIRLPILGLMELLASSRLLGDTDVLGGGAMNAGFVIAVQDGQPLALRVVKIDAGEAFNWDGPNNQFIQSFNPRYRGYKLKDPKDLQFGNMQPKVIQWDKLLGQQKQRFLSTLQRGYEALQDETLLDFMIHRRGAFDEAVPGRTLLRPDMVAEFKEAWLGYMKDQVSSEVYGAELAALPAAVMGASVRLFNPKPIGAASCTFEEARALSQAS